MQKSYKPVSYSLQDLSPTTEARFWKYVCKTESCWIWFGARLRNGYGALRAYKRKRITAHRLSWMFAHRQAIPEGLNVLHRCDNPSCVNPDHLFVGTMTDNILDAISKGRWNHPPKPGPAHSYTVSSEQIKQIRELTATLTYPELAKQFGIGVRTVGRIVRGERCYKPS